MCKYVHLFIYMCVFVCVCIVYVYPSVKLATIKKAVRYFNRVLNAATKIKINLFLENIHFCMSATLISFDG